MIRIEVLIWDEWNVEHIARPRVLPVEVEAVLRDPRLLIRQAYTKRYMALGRSGKRLLAVIIAEERKQGEFYVITARDMDKLERRVYRKEVRNGQEKKRTKI